MNPGLVDGPLRNFLAEHDRANDSRGDVGRRERRPHYGAESLGMSPRVANVALIEQDDPLQRVPELVSLLLVGLVLLLLAALLFLLLLLCQLLFSTPTSRVVGADSNWERRTKRSATNWVASRVASFRQGRRLERRGATGRAPFAKREKLETSLTASLPH